MKTHIRKFLGVYYGSLGDFVSTVTYSQCPLTTLNDMASIHRSSDLVQTSHALLPSRVFLISVSVLDIQCTFVYICKKKKKFDKIQNTLATQMNKTIERNS